MTGLIPSFILLVLALTLAPLVIDSCFGAETDDITDSFPGCVVAGGETDVVLTQDLLDADVTWVSAITATGAGAVPVADSYVAGTNTLTVSGLGVDTPQDLTVTYSYSVIKDFSGLGAIIRIVPLLFIVGIILTAIVVGIWDQKYASWN